MNYGQLVEELKDLPPTWYPALLAVMVEACKRKNVFKPGMIHEFVKHKELASKTEGRDV